MHTERNKILLEIDQLVETFKEQYSVSKSNSRNIPLIEIDLMKNSLRDLYQQLQMLEKLQENIQPENNIVIPGMRRNIAVEQKLADKKESISYPEAELNIPADKSILFADLLIENEVEENSATADNFGEEQILKPVQAEYNPVATARINNYIHTSALVESPTEIKPEVSNYNEITEAAQNAAIEIPVEIKEIPQKKEAFNKKQSTTLFDEEVETVGGKYKEQETLYSQISKTRNDETVADKLHRKPLADLKKSIGINERFSFINELFDGSQQKFTESIDKINNFSSYDEAQQLLHGELAKTFNWDNSSASLTLLDNLIKRRFGM